MLEIYYLCIVLFCFIELLVIIQFIRSINNLCKINKEISKRISDLGEDIHYLSVNIKDNV